MLIQRAEPAGRDRAGGPCRRRRGSARLPPDGPRRGVSPLTAWAKTPRGAIVRVRNASSTASRPTPRASLVTSDP